MDSIASQILEQSLKVSRSAHASTPNNSLFHLYLALFERDTVLNARFVNNEDTESRSAQGNENTFADIEAHHYRRPNLVFNSYDYRLQVDYAKTVVNEDNANLQLLNAMHPQGLAERNNPLVVDENVIENASYRTQQTIKQIFEDLDTNETSTESLQSNEIQVDETLLYDLIPQASAFSNTF
jgi:hypothetical protein